MHTSVEEKKKKKRTNFNYISQPSKYRNLIYKYVHVLWSRVHREHKYYIDIEAKLSCEHIYNI